ncbi:MGMT family protein [Acinetobacter sp. ANC 3832]|uniref:MGMT family protein n=1 Tax=Acinetobacter sp. ANC 3832 TaxID=1977874 RepID=UPI000A34D04A|nr:MGMT family protein [Acinetobacter sp. ANC 3832]OTG92540.1 methyltransferase [Acinetobacter sp. ANC 3832]
MQAKQTFSSDELARQILEVIALIPYGKVASYGQVAKMAGLPKHARLVGYVLKNLDDDVKIPWFRVINSQGKISLSKLNEKGENIQKLKLLDEGIDILNDKVNMKVYTWNNDMY